MRLIIAGLIVVATFCAAAPGHAAFVTEGYVRVFGNDTDALFMVDEHRVWYSIPYGTILGNASPYTLTLQRDLSTNILVGDECGFSPSGGSCGSITFTHDPTASFPTAFMATGHLNIAGGIDFTGQGVMTMTAPRRIKCAYCWAEWPVLFLGRAGKMRSGWVSLANHLEDRAGEGGHPALSIETLVRIKRGFAPPWLRVDPPDTPPHNKED